MNGTYGRMRSLVRRLAVIKAVGYRLAKLQFGFRQMD